MRLFAGYSDFSDFFLYDHQHFLCDEVGPRLLLVVSCGLICAVLCGLLINAVFFLQLIEPLTNQSLPLSQPSPTVPPFWELEPQDVEVVAGADVLMQCCASGFPRPTITWEKTIGKHRPSSNSIKLHQFVNSSAPMPSETR